MHLHVHLHGLVVQRYVDELHAKVMSSFVKGSVDTDWSKAMTRREVKKHRGLTVMLGKLHYIINAALSHHVIR